MAIFSCRCQKCGELSILKGEAVTECERCGYQIFVNEKTRMFIRLFGELGEIGKEKEDGQFL